MYQTVVGPKFVILAGLHALGYLSAMSHDGAALVQLYDSDIFIVSITEFVSVCPIDVIQVL